MSRKNHLKRLLWLGAALLALLALVFGVLFQVSTGRVLERAEALQLRRMLVTRVGDPQTDRFFFATSRRRDPAGSDPDLRFARELGEGLHLGFFDTQIEPSLGLGMLIDPTDWFQTEEIRLRDVRALERAEFVEQLRSQVERSPHRSLLVSVHGFRERFHSALRKTAFLGHVLDINSPLLVFDWPGDQGSTPSGYRRAQETARAAGPALAELLALVIREVRPARLWLVANSMGGEVVVTAFTQLAQEPDLADAESEIEDVVFTAPDVSHEEFGHQFRDEITALARKVTVYVSSNDRALLMSRVLNRGRRLGESTVDPRNPDQWDEAARAFELVLPDDEQVVLVDVTPVNRTRNFHNFSLETPEFFDDLFLRLTNQETPTSRLQYRVESPSGAAYWVLTRGR